MSLDNPSGIVLVLLVLGSLEIFNWVRYGLICASVQEISEQLETDKQERRRIKCTGLFSRLFRELDKLPNFSYFQHRLADDLVEVGYVELEGEAASAIRIMVKPEFGSYEQGQFTALTFGDELLLGSEKDLKGFAKDTRYALDSMMDSLRYASPEMSARYRTAAASASRS